MATNDAEMAQAALALGSPREALEHCTAALNELDQLDHQDDSDSRATVYLVRARAYRALGANAAAYQALEAHYALRSNVEAVAALEHARQLTAQLVAFERLSMTDALTGVANRRHLDERAAVEIAEVRRKGAQLAVAMLDIDHFKCVNDTHGHAVGDLVLQHVARVAREWLRPADFIARVGGEEFAVLLPGAGLPDADAIAERIRASIAGVAVVNGNGAVSVTTSFGVARFDPDADSFDSVLRRADAALYAAKEAGRNRVYDENGYSPAASP